MKIINGKSNESPKVLGVVAEYNPWHKGHKYQLLESMKLCGAEYSVAIMNGDFTQRGEPAVLDKWTRTENALKGGFDLVIELPFYFGCNSAEFFAKGAVEIAEATKTITHLAFGSESGDIKSIEKVAKFLADEPPEFSQVLGEKLKDGISFPKARMEAIGEFFSEEEKELLASPNNILAIEYVKQIYKQGSKIMPVTIKRKGDGYNDKEFDKVASATAIRKALQEAKKIIGNGSPGFEGAGGSVSSPGFEGADGSVGSPGFEGAGGLGANQGAASFNTKFEKIKKMLPEETYDIISENLEKLVFKDNEQFYDLLRYVLLSQDNLIQKRQINSGSTACHKNQLSQMFSAVEGIENVFLKNIRCVGSLDELLSKVKSKRYTYAGLSRLACHMVMGFTKDVAEPKYIRVLGFTDRGRDILKMFKENVKEGYELVTNINKASGKTLEDLSLDIKASDIYNMISHRDLYENSDFTTKPVMILK